MLGVAVTVTSVPGRSSERANTLHLFMKVKQGIIFPGGFGKEDTLLGTSVCHVE